MPVKKGESPFLTTGERVRNFLGLAIVLSLFIHFIAAPFLKTMSQTNEEQQVEKVAVTHKIKVKVPTPPPPTPTPKPTPEPKVAPQPQKPQQQLKVNVVHQKSSSSGAASERAYVAPKSGSEQGVPQGAATGPPANVKPGPAETPKPACRNPYQDATVVQQVTPDYPDSARSLGLGQVTVQVEVTLSATGSLISEKIYASGNNSSLDNAALSAARQSTYAPKIVNCQATQGDYLFKVTFDPNS